MFISAHIETGSLCHALIAPNFRSVSDLALKLLDTQSMDRKIKKRRFPFKWIGGLLALLSCTAFFLYQMIYVDKHPTVYAERAELQVATVSREMFQEYVNVTGIMAPGDSLHLDTLEGGQVKEIFAKAGDRVRNGDPILALENTDLEMDALLKEAQIVEKEFELQRARVNCTKRNHELRDEMLDLEFRITRLDKEHRRHRGLAEADYIPAEAFEEIADNYFHWEQKRQMLVEAIGIEERLNEKTVKQIEAGLNLLRTDFKKTRKRIEDLQLIAPATGLLTSLDATVGETKNKGERIGQIDLTDQIKVIAQVDEYYAGRVMIGNTGTLEVFDAEAGREMVYDLRVLTISPEIRSNEFEVEFAFVRKQPNMVRLGQSFTVRIALGRAYGALVLKKGPFVQTTGGAWVYVMNADTKKGVRRSIKIGRHNPDYFEVLDGLTEGEQVIVSAYDNYAGVDVIEIN